MAYFRGGGGDDDDTTCCGLASADDGVCGCCCPSDKSPGERCAWGSFLSSYIVYGAMIIAALVLGAYATNLVLTLRSAHYTAEAVHVYPLVNGAYGTAQLQQQPPSGAQWPHGVGALRLDSAAVVAELQLQLYGVDAAAAVTAVHLYGPLAPGVPSPAEAIALKGDLAGASASSISAHVRVFSQQDIVRVVQSPWLYFVGVSTTDHPHGTYLRWSLGGELLARVVEL